MERIIKASSNSGDIVLAPFCGCATTLVAAENLGRQWVGIDKVKQAAKEAKKRMIKMEGALKTSGEPSKSETCEKVLHPGNAMSGANCLLHALTPNGFTASKTANAKLADAIR